MVARCSLSQREREVSNRLHVNEGVEGNFKERVRISGGSSFRFDKGDMIKGQSLVLMVCVCVLWT